MRTLVVYFSQSGNTAWAAERIGEILGAGLLPLRPRKPYPERGAARFLLGGKSAVFEEKPPLQSYDFRPEDWDQVIFGFPVWASNVAPPIRTFAEEQGAALAGKQLAAFACQSGSGAEKAFRKLLACLGAERFGAELILTDPKLRPKEEDMEKLAAFCEQCR